MKYKLIVHLKTGVKELVRNVDNVVIATFPPNVRRFICPEWDEYRKEHEDVAKSWELVYSHN